jgi:hypothetical protein
MKSNEIGGHRLLQILRESLSSYFLRFLRVDYGDGIKEPPHFEECGGQTLDFKWYLWTNQVEGRFLNVLTCNALHFKV